MMEFVVKNCRLIIDNLTNIADDITFVTIKIRSSISVDFQFFFSVEFALICSDLAVRAGPALVLILPSSGHASREPVDGSPEVFVSWRHVTDEQRKEPTWR